LLAATLQEEPHTSTHLHAPYKKLVSGENEKSSVLIFGVLISGAIVPFQGVSVEVLLANL